jgi:ABC-type branched-subunit amino acid transport system substrate-binding protein
MASAMLIGVVALSCSSNNGTSDKTPGSNTPGATPTVDDSTATPYAGVIIGPTDVLKKDGTATKNAEVKWGFMFEISGGLLQFFGQPTGDGVKLAVKEINEAGGFQVGDTIYTIRLIERDTKSDIPNTIAVTQELVQAEGVNVIFGPATLGETEASLITQRAKVLHLCPCQERELNALSSVEKAEGESHWAFQTLLPFSLLIEQGARSFVRDYPQFHSMALLCQNSAAGHDVCGRTAKAYSAVGIDVTAEEYYPQQTSDFSPFLTRIKAGDPDFLFSFEPSQAQATLIKQALELGVGRLHLATLPADLIQTLVGRPLTVPVTAGAAARQHGKPTSQEAADYFERYKAFLDGAELPFVAFGSLLTYDFVYMLVAAMQEAGTVEDTTAIADALENLHYNGVAEDDIFFNRRHFAVIGTETCTVQEGKPTECTHNPPPPEAFK